MWLGKELECAHAVTEVREQLRFLWVVSQHDLFPDVVGVIEVGRDDSAPFTPTWCVGASHGNRRTRPVSGPRNTSATVGIFATSGLVLVLTHP